ncbi:AAA family ATPase [Allorhizobium pseudoryzae]|uniref:AAA family ATPase n=1 Tax=Allorhizobium pseudoryzae TaxID=379684 RepID=UPI003CFEE973
MDRFIIISGCSGGGKSTLLGELRRRGYSTVEEPGRRIVADELASAGNALPWTDMAAFARRAMALALQDRDDAIRSKGFVFFDRSLIDASVALAHVTGEDALTPLQTMHRYHRLVFLTPPWPEIYTADAERRHGFDAAIDEYHRLSATYPALHYDVMVLPKISVEARADFLLDCLSIEGVAT